MQCGVRATIAAPIPSRNGRSGSDRFGVRPSVPSSESIRRKACLPHRGLSTRLDQRHRVRGDALAPARESHPLGRRRLDVDPADLDAEIGGEVRAHPVEMRREPRGLSDDRGVGVHHREPPGMEKSHDPAKQDAAVDPGKFRARIRKVPADVPEPRRTEQCVAQCMNDDVAVGMGGEPSVELDGDPAEDQPCAGREPMGVESVADSVHDAILPDPHG